MWREGSVGIGRLITLHTQKGHSDRSAPIHPRPRFSVRVSVEEATKPRQQALFPPLEHAGAERAGDRSSPARPTAPPVGFAL